MAIIMRNKSDQWKKKNKEREGEGRKKGLIFFHHI